MMQAERSHELTEGNPSELMCLFDVIYGGSVMDLKRVMSGDMWSKLSVKVIGEDRYYFVVQPYLRDCLPNLRFPKGSTVTQYLIQHFHDFFKVFDDGIPPNKKSMPHGSVLAMTVWDVIPDNSTTEGYNDKMATFVRMFASTFEKVDHETFATTASYPPRVFSVSKLKPNVMQYCVKAILDAIGGSGHSRISTKCVIKV